MQKIKLLLWLGCLFFSDAYSWNKLGHRLIAQIAYNQLDEPTKKFCNHYHHALDKVYGRKSLVNAAPWLDNLRYLNRLWLQNMHYIDTPFSIDGTKLRPANSMNAVVAIEKATAILQDKKAYAYDKGFSLRVLFHVVGDIHQPLHAISRYSKNLPYGDKGGNLVRLSKNKVANNLHAYWDKGGGLLLNPHENIKIKALQISSHYPCDKAANQQNPKIWADESHQLAITNVYKLTSRTPSKEYQDMVKHVSEQRIALAGCRLAVLLKNAAIKYH